LTERELPPAEWAKLADTELGTVWPLLDPHHTRVIAVEDETGRVIASWAIFPVYHLEGISIAEDYRKHPGVIRALLRLMRSTASDVGATTVMTAAVTEEIEDYITRLGGTELPGKHFMMTLGSRH
jgi:hypothetical protein